jgi:hypothetical protein
MKKLYNKNMYRGFLILSFVLIISFILFGISAVWVYLNTGADRGNMLHTELKNEEVYHPKITWEPLKNEGRLMDKSVLKDIEKDYLRAWYTKNRTFKTNIPFGIDDYYTDSARVNIYNTIKINKNKKVTIEATSLNHEPTLNFYSEDGTLAVFTDKNVIEYQKVYQDKKLILINKDTSNYKVLVLLEDGFWRIRHLVKMTSEKLKKVKNSEPLVSVKQSQIFVDDKPFTIKGINYYPQATPWNMFGDKFDEKIIDTDFKIIKESGLNCVRIFVQYEDFGKAKVTKEKLDKLKKVLDLAATNNLKVVVTLFDFYGDYTVLNWTLTQRHVEQIVTTFKDHKAILAWDIKNEPDLDFKSRKKEVVLAWLSQLILEIKKFDTNHLITVGWSSMEAAVNLKDEVDIVSYHYYQNINNFETNFQQLKKEAPNKPLVLQEYGVSSYRGFWNPFGYSEKEQAVYHKKMQAIFKKDSLAFMSWSLYDFRIIPTSVAGNFPWRKNKQKHFGFIDIEGNLKPSFLYISH